MKIKYVDYPSESHKYLIATYDSNTKSCRIKKNQNKQNIKWLIRHEYGHYLIDKNFSIKFIKHYLNLFYEIIWILLFYKPCFYKYSIEWTLKYYVKARKLGQWVY